MMTLLNKATATLSGAVVFCIGCVMAGVGLMAAFTLALFGLAIAGLSLLAAPFIGSAPAADDAPEQGATA
ncbi:MAG: hypothetical protein KJP02_09120 [Octadecabacter sp.]|nr:hypothetical protein [Octadecabacter sp.]